MSVDYAVTIIESSDICSGGSAVAEVDAWLVAQGRSYEPLAKMARGVYHGDWIRNLPEQEFVAVVLGARWCSPEAVVLVLARDGDDVRVFRPYDPLLKGPTPYINRLSAPYNAQGFQLRHKQPCDVCVKADQEDSAYWHTTEEHEAAGGTRVWWWGFNRPFGKFMGWPPDFYMRPGAPVPAGVREMFPEIPKDAVVQRVSPNTPLHWRRFDRS